MIGALLAKPAVAGVVGFLRGIPREVWYALIIALAAWWAYDAVYDRGAASRDAEVAGLASTLEAERAANQSNIDTIAKLVAENKAWAAKAEAATAAADEIVDRLITQRDALAKEVRQLRRERETIYANDPSAAAWARQPVPAAVADQLRRE